MITILLIEDNLEIRENTTEILELGGFKVVTAENGRDGIETARSLVPDIVLCDIMMPDVDGYQVIRELKADMATKHIPFIYVTASGEKNEIKLAMDMGANGYVRKPFEIKELFAEINKCIP